VSKASAAKLGHREREIRERREDPTIAVIPGLPCPPGQNPESREILCAASGSGIRYAAPE
jgi:hypothetical protein